MKYMILICLICFAGLSQAQDKISKKAVKAFEEGKRYFLLNDLKTALPLLEKAIKIQPDFTQANIFLAQAYERTGRLEEALDLYIKVGNDEPSVKFKSDFSAGKLHHQLGNFEEAALSFENYISFDRLSDKQRADGKRRLKNAQFAKEAIKNPVDFDPVNLGPEINSDQMEYFPSLSADESVIVFTRRKGVGQSDNEDFYISAKKENWKIAKNFERLNTKNNEGAQSVASDGNSVFFAAKDRKDGYGNFDIWMSTRTKTGWSVPVNLGAGVNTAGWESQPSISADGKTLVFVSKRQEGTGENDIYVSEFKNGKWQKAELIDGEINTPYNEESPFLHHDGETLYFSSKGHIGMGGADLFISRKDKNGKWSKPENLGYPINSVKDEVSLTVSALGENAYFASNREDGFGKEDIYKFKLPEIIKPKPITYFKGIVKDAISKKPLDASIQLMDLSNGETVERTTANINDGSFLSTLKADKEYACNVSKTGYLFHSENFTFKTNPEGKPYEIEIFLEPIKVKIASVESAKEEIKVGTKVVLNNIFFDSGKFDLLPASQAELNRLVELLNENPDLKIQINGHTDDVGSESDNQQLSEKRASSVVKYLSSKGINPNRLSFKGYGESQPIADNTSVEGKRLNRRTEFEVVK